MDWKNISFDWNRARAFLITAEEGSLSAAARALGMTQPTLGRQVTALEDELGVVLFERGPRSLELTPDGFELVEYVRNMAEAANHLSLAASGRSTALHGPICVSAPQVMSCYLLPAVLKRLRDQEPGFMIELVASDQVSDLRRREADIAVRAFRPTQPDLIARRVADVQYKFYCTHAYAAKLDRYLQRGDIEQITFIGFDKVEHLLQLMNQQGLPLTLAQVGMSVNHSVANWQLVKQGAGVGLMIASVGDNDDSMQEVLHNIQLPLSETWLVAHRELRTNRRLKIAFDYLAEAFSPNTSALPSNK